MEKDRIENFRRTVRRIEAEAEHQLKYGEACCGVSLAQCHVLMELGASGPLSIKQLSGLLRLDKSTLSRTVEGMVRGGTAKRTARPDDRRFAVVKLTPAGKRQFERVNEACNLLYRQVFRHIPEERHTHVMECLALFADAVEAARSEMTTAKSPGCGVSGPASEGNSIS